MNDLPHRMMSAADQRGHDWLYRWAALGNGLTNDEQGHLQLSHSGDAVSEEMAAQLAGDCLLAHAVGRAFLNYLKWDYARNPGDAA